MNKKRLGRTELMVSEIGAGCWTIGGSAVNLDMGAGWDGVNVDGAKKGLLYAVQNGVNIFDTADVYGMGQSERLIGWLLKEMADKKIAKREDIRIVTKVGYFKGCASHGFDSLHMRHQLEMSLKNLNTEYVDVYFFHHLDFGQDNEYLENAIDQMRNFQKKGLIRYIGLRGPHKFSLFRKTKKESFDGGYDNFLKLSEIINPDVISVRYNMITPTYDNSKTDIFKLAKEKNWGILTYKSLGQGLLLNKYDSQNPPIFSESDHRRRKTWFKSKGLEILRKKLDAIGQKFGCQSTRDFVHLAVKYCLSRDQNHCVVVGFRDETQLKDSLSTEGILNQGEVEFIREVFSGINKEIGQFIDL